jgi:hypothetical protein
VNSSSNRTRPNVVRAGTANGCTLIPWFESGVSASKSSVGSSATVSDSVVAATSPSPATAKVPR